MAFPLHYWMGATVSHPNDGLRANVEAIAVSGGTEDASALGKKSLAPGPQQSRFCHAVATAGFGHPTLAWTG